MYDLAVIGGGILGTFHAYHALQMGLTVALFEKNKEPQGATVRNFGQIVPSGMNPKWQALGRQSLAIYQAIQQQFNISIVKNGSIYLASNAQEVQLIEELHQINKANDYPSELLTAEACLKKYPALRKDYCRAGLFFPDELSADPRYMIHQIQTYLRQNPRFTHFTQTLITQIDTQTNACKLTDHLKKTYQAQKVALCCGSEFELLYPHLFYQSDMEVVKLQMLRLQPNTSVKLPGNILTGLTIRRYESFQQCPSYQAIKATENPQAYHKKWGIHLLFKQEADGSIIVGDSHEYADAQHKDQLDFFIRDDINRYFIEETKKILNLPNLQIQTQWAGFYAQGKNTDIFYHNLHDKVHITTAIGGKGMTAGPGFALQNIKTIFNQ
ncbi:MAG TPA: TIGR03364 family FAD-dependent oxidoreductase [Chitinophagales bacterium]|nr:TIGR03364 family FAD-dependent oxidoreductase [Chitinophagales bacterium]HRK26140.1 TIGR03364 family FAD-dependent oxidoreductase [Chitinophagales bacterium]